MQEVKILSQLSRELGLEQSTLRKLCQKLKGEGSPAVNQLPDGTWLVLPDHPDWVQSVGKTLLDPRAQKRKLKSKGVRTKLIRVVIADDDPVWREAIIAQLEAEPEIEIVAVAHNGFEALAYTRQFNPDVLVLDCVMPGLTGSEVLGHLKAGKSDSKPGVLAFSNDQSLVKFVKAQGADKFLWKYSPPTDFVQSIKELSKLGEVAILTSPNSQTTQQKSVLQVSPCPFTGRELAVLRELETGKEPNAVAQVLGLEQITVKNHIQNMYKKLGDRIVHNRYQLIKLALDNGWLEPD